MQFFKDMIGNMTLVSAAMGWLVAQVLKTLIYCILNKSFSPERMVGSGGMPSSHSSTVSALAMAAFIQYGVGSFQFTISLFFAIIVMHDAMGVRRETEIQAHVLNEILDIFVKMGHREISPQDRLKEFVGHTPLQVVIGALIGIVVAITVSLFY